MSFERFPYTNFHELNLDWIVQKLKEAYSSENPPDYPVKSVNGMTGDVILAIPSIYVHSVNGETGDVVLYRNPLTQFPATDETRWNLFRICDGTEKGIEFDADSAKRIAGTRRILIYDEDNPPDYPVTSVNGQTGDVQITAGVQSVNGKTGNVVTPFVNPNTDILTLDSNSPSVLWGISRNVAGGNVALYITTGGTNPQAFIRFIPDGGGQAINLPLLTNIDIPESAGVVSVNTKTGAVTLYGTDIKISDSNNVSISEQITTNTQNMETILSLILESEADTSFWESGFINPFNGTNSSYEGRIRTKTYIPEKCTEVRLTSENITLILYAWDSSNNYVGRWQTTEEFLPNADNLAILRSVDFSDFRIRFPGYKYKLVAFSNQTQITTEDSSNIIFESNKLIKIEVNEELIRNDITDLQVKDSEHDDDISALQSADVSINQQISALQSVDTTHSQQISALQSVDTTHSQQIAELYTIVGSGIKEVKFTDIVSLPIRYPETGTDADIAENMACVNAVLSRPGVQRTNLTIVFYNGYLTISGTVQGMTDITLYLTKT